ncbi:hypothetical protein LCGC14_2947380 [marine sediment metagenome]|uniref:Uncharacterized protein n=1 Tax=marine sediment metagenome TaxID=412755 RepID=A0A0F8XGT2_9ZZZZ
MSKKSWLCRDSDGWYKKCPLAKRPSAEACIWEQYDRNGAQRAETISARDFEREFPNVKGRLKPGDGPVRVEFEMRFCDE